MKQMPLKHVVAGFLLIGFCSGTCTNSPAWASQAPPAVEAVKSYEVREITDVAYYDGPDADPIRHRLDLYVPKGRKNFPVIFFVHGGAWSYGDKNLFGTYHTLGRFWAGQGVGLVVTNYRLSPGVKHPEHIKDVARAFAWTCKNIHRYGGSPEKIFVSGHSAGAHLVALLATDDTYVKAEGLSRTAIKGAIPWCGIFIIPPRVAIFESVFGKNPAVRRSASPISHASAAAPPFLIIYADDDLPGCDKPQAEAFCKALKAKNVAAQTLEVRDRNHMTLFLKAARANDPVAIAVRDFITAHVGP